MATKTAVIEQAEPVGPAAPDEQTRGEQSPIQTPDDASPAGATADTTPGTDARARRTPLVIVGIVAAGVVLAAALFGGGVLVGANLPGQGPGTFQGGPFPGGDGRGFPDGAPD